MAASFFGWYASTLLQLADQLAAARWAFLKLAPLLHAGAKMSYNVSYDAGLTLLTPTLLVPTEGVRVEVNGQVLSRGSDLAASQAEDTTAPTMGSTT